MDNTLCDTYHTLTIRQWNFVADGFEKKGRLDVAKALRRRAGKQSFISVLKDLELSEQEKRFAVKRYDDNPVKNLKLFPDANAILATPIPKILMTRGEKILQQKKKSVIYALLHSLTRSFLSAPSKPSFLSSIRSSVNTNFSREKSSWSGIVWKRRLVMQSVWVCVQSW